jgi:hypothetical protein
LPNPPAGLPKLADVHTRLFNATNLPVSAFLNFVILPDLLCKPVPGWGRALVSIVSRVYQSFSQTARGEGERLASAAGTKRLFEEDERLERRRQVKPFGFAVLDRRAIADV